MTLGLFFAPGFKDIVNIFPMPILGVILFFEGLMLAYLMKDILELLEKEPLLAEINRKYTRDAAYYAAKTESKK